MLSDGLGSSYSACSSSLREMNRIRSVRGTGREQSLRMAQVMVISEHGRLLGDKVGDGASHPRVLDASILLEREPQSRRCQDGPTCGW
jgi:hypothetical protein